jgi:hypothetical protein
MAKVQKLVGNDLSPVREAPASASRQRGAVPSKDLVPMQFRMPAEFVKAFKQAALDRDLKLNDLFELCFNDFMKK